MDNNLKILITDDHESIRDGMKFILSSSDYSDSDLFEAENGQLAIDRLKHTSCDIVFMDISMPVMNGIEATKIIREQFPQVKIVICSMHLDSVDILELIDLGVAGYILKEEFANSVELAINTVQKGDSYYSVMVKEIIDTLKEC